MFSRKYPREEYVDSYNEKKYDTKKKNRYFDEIKVDIFF